MMKLHFTDQTFSFELLRTASYGLYGGSEIGEVLATAKQIREGDFESWHIAWQRTAARIEALAVDALQNGHRVSAGQSFLRASNYYRTAEFFLAPSDPRRMVAFEKSRTTFWQFLELSGLCAERVSIPYEGTTLPGYFYRADDSHAPKRTLLSLGGFDSTGEELYFFAAAAALRRGYNVLTFEGPGQGEPLRMEHMPARSDYEVPVRAAVDYLLTRPEVDRERIALMGTSLGGYYAARAAAFEPRVKALIIHGVMFDFWATQSRTKPLLRLLGQWKSPSGLQAVLHLAERFNSELRWSVKTGMWVLGAQNPVELKREMKRYSLKEVASLIQQPTLILHGAKDHFAPQEQLDMLFAALKAPKTLRVFTEEEGAEEHCQIGNMTLLHQVLFDWLDETL
ncbi:MAG: alpha/beta fold hydrolase [Thermoflexales bacterium]